LQNLKIEEQIANTRGEIYASILHDINGPLTVISGFVQLMNQRFGDAKRLEVEDLEFIKDRLKIITRQVTNCIEISRRYLGFLRKQSDDAPRVGVNQLFSDLHHLINVHPSLQHNKFSIEPLPEDIGVKVNGTDLIQILLNLAVNAFQCTPQSHRVSIKGQLLHDALDLQAFKDGPEARFLNVESFANMAPLVQVSVCDNGPGIPADVLPRIFQPYFTTKSARQGTGLGLNIVQRLVKEAKGALHVQTRLGEGTEFTVYLPAAKLTK
jgi:signal transduction histidine kinase